MRAKNRLSFLLVTLLFIIAGVLGRPAIENQDHCAYPSLLNATSDQLQDGLGKGCFTSVGLVQVLFRRLVEVLLGPNPEGYTNAE